MTSPREVKSELFELLEALCEERLTPEQHARLEHLVLKSRSARKLYLSYLHLHGTLLWDAAQSDSVILSASAGARNPIAFESSDQNPSTSFTPSSRASDHGISGSRASVRRNQRVFIAGGGIVCLTCLLIVLLQLRPAIEEEATLTSAPVNSSVLDPMYDVPREPAPHYRPFPLDALTADKGPTNPQNVTVKSPKPAELPLDVVEFVDREIEKGWNDSGIKPSDIAPDTDWLRRIYLDLAGRIPSAREVNVFLSDSALDKRQKVVDGLLASDDFNRNFATVWTNLLVGRSEPDVGDRTALFNYLEGTFAQNQPWDATVAAFISAEGSVDADPAANFLVAHLNNEAVPATAITARVFLGTQVQCMQCHNHPFNDWTQQDFWEMNSFFQQTKLTRDNRGKAALVSTNVGGPMLFETRNGLMKAAYPRYQGHEISADKEVNRRKEFARLIAGGDKPQIASAFVNRTWAQLLGSGFTNPIDDMGPHNPPSHPLVLDTLTRAFVASGYDVKKLVRSITSTKAYHLSSRFNDTNENDNPGTGEIPLFSRGYPKPMTVEQVYDSLIVATGSDNDQVKLSDVANRNQWVHQFVRTYETDENDESVHFQGSVPAALALMNGEIVAERLEPQPGTTLHQALSTPGGDEAKLQRLAIATLNRPLTERESAAFKRLIRQQVMAVPVPLRKNATVEAYQDALWAMINSAEFITVP